MLDEFGAFPAVAERELRRYLPFLATTKVLIAAVKNGVGRETAHEAIKEHAVAVALEMREKGIEHNDLFDRLAADPRLGLTREQLDALVSRADRVHRRRPRPGQRRRRRDRAPRGRAPRRRRLRPRAHPRPPGYSPAEGAPGCVRGT